MSTNEATPATAESARSATELDNVERRFASSKHIPGRLKAAGLTLTFLSSVAASFLAFKDDIGLFIGVLCFTTLLLVGLWALLQDRRSRLVHIVGVAGLVLVFFAGCYFVYEELTRRYSPNVTVAVRAISDENGRAASFLFDASPVLPATSATLVAVSQAALAGAGHRISVGPGGWRADGLQPASVYDAFFLLIMRSKNSV